MKKTIPISILLILLSIAIIIESVRAPSVLDDTDTDWNGTMLNMNFSGSGAAANLTSQGANITGFYASRVIDAGTDANWSNVTISTEVPYGIEIGRALGDANNSNPPYINTTGLVLLMHFNNESADGENNSLVRDFSPDVNPERTGGVRNNGTLNVPGFNFTNYKFGGAGVFDGSSSFIDVPDSNSLDSTSNVTVAFWLMLPSFGTNAYHGIFGKLEVWCMAGVSDGRFVVLANKSSKEIEPEYVFSWWELRDALYYFFG